MTYKLEFYEDAYKEWKKLDATVREQFKLKLIECLENPCILSAKFVHSNIIKKVQVQAAWRSLAQALESATKIQYKSNGRASNYKF